jgi:hypothetical protein
LVLSSRLAAAAQLGRYAAQSSDREQV